MTLCLLSLDLGVAFCDHALLLWKGGVFLTMARVTEEESRLGACLGISRCFARPFPENLGTWQSANERVQGSFPTWL